ncbi:uncharacterized protein LOC125177886 [Hyalella azteca]|uniref:Uncharacterized protein LOC125177886 n=1 Tax=Hyalella azteca TaxID=294128 RepID=A0A979FIM9_HYAAZ|nr:uncharacterized protein LOC125177886 [Hyalella azteca]
MNIKTFLCVTAALTLMIRQTFSTEDNSDKKFYMNNDQQASHELLGCDAAKVAEEAGRHLGETIKDQFLRHSKVNLKNLTLPFLPLISLYQVSLALTNVQILGLEKFTLNVDVLGNKNKSFTFSFPQLTLLADYVAGGHVNDLPFVGESTLNATLIEPSMQVWYWQKPGTKFCALENSTVYQLNLASMDINFDDLNPGQDSGQLINTMLNAYAKDLAFLLTMALNDETKLHPKVDNIVVKIINNKCPMYHSYLAKTLRSIQDEIKLGELRSKIAAPVFEPETKFQRKIQVDSNDNVHDFYFTKKEFSTDLIENMIDVEQELKFSIEEEASKEIEEP